MKKIYFTVTLLIILCSIDANAQSWFDELKKKTQETRQEINKKADALKKDASKYYEQTKEKYKEYAPIIRRHGKKGYENVTNAARKHGPTAAKYICETYDKYGPEIGLAISDAYEEYGEKAARNTRDAYDKYVPTTGKIILDAYIKYGPEIGEGIENIYHEYGPETGKIIAIAYDTHGIKIGNAIKEQTIKIYEYFKTPEPWAITAGVTLAICDQTGTTEAVNKITKIVKNSNIKINQPTDTVLLREGFSSLYAFAKLTDFELTNSIIIYPESNSSLADKFSSINIKETQTPQIVTSILSALKNIRQDIQLGKDINESVNQLNQLTNSN